MYADKGDVPEDEYLIPIGKAEVKKAGTDVTIVSFGKIIKVVYQAAEILENEGISCEIIDLRTVRPLDHETIVHSVKKTNRLVIVEEAWPLASISSEITYQVQKHAFDYLDAPISRITTPDTPLGYAPTFVEAFLPSVTKIVTEVKKVTYRKS
jgi:pyruvate dehydrogenase E1 component beta subunit